MKKMQKLMSLGVMALALAAAAIVSAQPGGGGGFGGGGGGGGFGGGGMQGMDLAEIQKMIEQGVNDSYREQMAVTNDEEWVLIEQRITAVTKAQSAMSADSGGGMGGLGGMMRAFGGGRGGRGGGGRGGGGAGGAGMLAGLLGQPSPEAEALQNAIDANAPAAQIKVLMEKFVAVRKAKEDALTKAREELRQVLTTRQEAVALVGGLL